VTVPPPNLVATSPDRRLRHDRRGGYLCPHANNEPNIVVEPRPDGRWACQKDGTRRAASLHDTQAAAVNAARAQAKRERAELVVKGKDGRIERRHIYGNDPRRTPG
jgi:hypothetical protein